MPQIVRNLNKQGKVSNVLRTGQLRGLNLRSKYLTPLKSGKTRNSKIRASAFGFEKVAEKEKSLSLEMVSPSPGLLAHYNFSKEDEKKYPVI